MIRRSFSEFADSENDNRSTTKTMLVGLVRNDADNDIAGDRCMSV